MRLAIICTALIAVVSAFLFFLFVKNDQGRKAGHTDICIIVPDGLVGLVEIVEDKHAYNKISKEVSGVDCGSRSVVIYAEKISGADSGIQGRAYALSKGVFTKWHRITVVTESGRALSKYNSGGKAIGQGEEGQEMTYRVTGFFGNDRIFLCIDKYSNMGRMNEVLKEELFK